MEQPKIKNLSIKALDYNLDNPIFDKLKNKKEILDLLPDKKSHKINFILTRANVAIANALRRVVLEELKIKAFEVNVSDISTNDKEIIISELADRIAFIPLDQDIPLDVVYALLFTCHDSEQEYTPVHSSKIMQIEGKRLNKLPFAGTFRLLEILPGRTISIPSIKITEGYGWEHSKFSIASDFKYQIRDYVDVHFLNERGNIISGMVRREELVDYMKKKKISHPLISGSNSSELYKKDILIIPDSSFQNMTDVRTRNKLQMYSVVLEDFKIEICSSMKSCPREFFLEFTTNGNIDPIIMMRMVCDNIVGRLKTISESANLIINSDGEKTEIMIKGESYTISDLIKRAILDLDPSIGLVNSTMLHPSIRTITINIRHPNAEKIFFDAVKNLEKIFSDLESQFNEKEKEKH
jgi:DNA-directed RNA polymerase subunit L